MDVACFCGSRYSVAGDLGACSACGAYAVLGRVSDAEESGMRAELEQLLAGATLDENPIQGPTAGQTPSEEPTVASEIGARPDEDSTHGPLNGKRPAEDPTRLTRPRRGAL